MKHLIILFTAFALFSCGGNEGSETTDPKTNNEDSTKVEEEAKIDIPEDRKYNDLAMYLAGKEGDNESTLKSLESSEAWKSYQKRIDLIWSNTNEKVPGMREWADKELSEVNSESGTLFYPFSGPDFLHADIFFPEFDNVVMIALEPIGSLPDMEEKAKKGSDEMYLNGVRKSLHSILGLSFFRTIAMADDLTGEVDGSLPVLMQFMNRTGHEVLYQEQVGVTADGKLSTDLKGMPDSTYVGNRYYFKKEGSDKIRTLTYFAANLQNMPYVSRSGLVANGLDQRTDFHAFLKSLDIRATYLKSASYLMHRPTFSKVRNVIIDGSDYVLEDDSGIPIKFFDEDKWDLTFYGNYSFPISLFSERHQPDLKEVYQGEGIKELPFGIGYQYKKGTSNLMLAKRKK